MVAGMGLGVLYPNKPVTFPRRDSFHFTIVSTSAMRADGWQFRAAASLKITLMVG